MKTETTTQPANTSPAKMAFDMYPSISSGKQQDPVREVVMKYIDYFLPDASGTSAVAIDNKIEQAMDLVKSHLMIAVREEVEVLKEKISELMDKINQLEVENTILKANMSQETLQQLQMQMQIAGSTPTNGSNMITAAPTPAAITAGPQTAAAAPTAVGSTQSSNAATAAATPQSNVGSGTATPTTQQQPIATTVEQQQDATVQNIEENVTAAATNGPMS